MQKYHGSGEECKIKNFPELLTVETTIHLPLVEFYFLFSCPIYLFQPTELLPVVMSIDVSWTTHTSLVFSFRGVLVFDFSSFRDFIFPEVFSLIPKKRSLQTS